MYSVKQLLKQEPNAVRTVVMAWLALAVVAGWIHVSPETLAAGGLAIEGSLTLFYVRPLSVSKDAIGKFSEAQDAKALQGVELGKLVARQRPLRTQGDAPAQP